MEEIMSKNYYFKKQRTGLMIIGGLMSLAIAFSLTPTFAGIVASIQNSVNTAATGTLTMEEKSGAVTCNSNDGAASTTNTAVCASINKYGGTNSPLTPGSTNTTNITIKNTGTLAATAFTVKGDTCTKSNVAGATFSGNGNLCDKINVKISSGATTIYQGTATAFANAGATNILGKLAKAQIAANEEVQLKIEATLDASADSAVQGQQISQPITWQFSA